ncbi:MAG: beta-ketoacyl-[acyl-carrier-protein] synthase II [Alphaproteobacteria bacterium 16-39-46]|nr:MAG: beta-ketoacyl-[acyl-carrier-protein] synthase II [Alphaproteobacteria bacterium 16-39-46]OZA42690.1 MAG: beta-ketoacyl-[acyl-carrier-protein] synthase II [Alphaproteobacteria bacterium 17-39-52]HQS84342.1 beta-ketoacyl-ACP synthase II [Alphaproteobacteria bacterium]HQS94168.1 beta-ketoacyl-ACP synthase II [Alphaproteobacteria bacterium]
MRRVVITGLGLVTPLGVGVPHVWKRLVSGDSGIQKITSFDTEDLATKIAGQIPRGNAPGSLHAEDFVNLKDQKKMGDFILYALAATAEALKDANWAPQDQESLERTGVLIGAGIGGLLEIANNALALDSQGPRRVSPFFIVSSLINLASGQVSIKYGFKGPNHSVVTACASGSHAIGDAARLIQYGDADVMVAGSSESTVCRLGISGFNAARALSTQYNDTPTKASRPWDKGHDGFVMGEGAGIVILEELEHAKKRGAPIYAEVLGYGLSGDAHHITAPAEDGDGAFRAMRNALKNANISPEKIDYINAHGTSTPPGDRAELQAVGRLMGENRHLVSISSTKSSIGHLLGGAGGVEAIFTILALKHQIVPPTLNLENPLDEAEGFDLIPLFAKERKVQFAISNSFGFGGTNASLVLGKMS